MMNRETSAPTVLVVEDDPVTLLLMDMVLSHVGYQPLLCAEARDAVTMIRERQPDVVTLDLRMGGDAEAGFTILAHLRRDPTTAAIPAIMCSSDREWMAAQAPRLRAQRCDMLAKPFDLTVLLDKLAQLIGPAPVQPVEASGSTVPTMV